MTQKLDRSVLAEATFGNEDLEREVLGLFRQQAERTLRQLMLVDDGFSPSEAIHTLKGSARSVGAVEVAELCQRLEHTLADEGAADYTTLRQAVADVDAEIACVLKA